MASLPAPPLTEVEYLRLDRAAEVKSEFHDGQMFAMSGGTFNHSLLATRIIAMMDRRVRPPCVTFNSDLRIKVPPAGLYTYPDAGVVCGPPQFAEGDLRDTLLNPYLLVEVLSPSTEAYDRGRKFESYRTLDSLCEYLLIHQDRCRVEHYSRQADGSWLLRDHVGEAATFTLDRLGVTISLAELYANVTNAGSPPASAN